MVVQSVQGLPGHVQAGCFCRCAMTPSNPGGQTSALKVQAPSCGAVENNCLPSSLIDMPPSSAVSFEPWVCLPLLRPGES